MLSDKLKLPDAISVPAKPKSSLVTLSLLTLLFDPILVVRGNVSKKVTDGMTSLPVSVVTLSFVKL